jgi:hypothetical protein
MRLRNRAVLVSVVTALMLLLMIFQGCRKERPGFERNLPPETYLSSVPLDSSFVFYRVKLYWGGLDPDGQVVGYIYAVVDSNLTPTGRDWVWTTDTEKEFSLLANNPEMLGHRFFCAAVDDKGLADPTPAFVFFYARDFHLPKIRYTSSYAVTPQGETLLLTAATTKQLVDSIPGDTIPTGSVAHFSWQGWDDDPGGYVTGYLYRTSDDALYRGGSLADTSYSVTVKKAGLLNFEAVAIDDAGAMSRRDSLRYFIVDNDPDTWIVPPCDTCCGSKKGRGFTESGSIPRCDGDTLRLAGNNVAVSFSWDGWDKDGQVVYWYYRMLRNLGGRAYAPIFQKTWGVSLEKSGDYQFLVKAIDNESKDDGTPASLRFYTNCAPFFEGERRCCCCPNGVYETCDRPYAHTVVVLSDSVYYDSLYCAACDVETPADKLEYAVEVNGKLGPWRPVNITGILQAILRPVDNLTKGSNTITVYARDRQPDGSAGRTASRTSYVDVNIP